MTCLFIDTSGEYLTVSLIKDNKNNTLFLENCGLKHSLTLMPTIEEVLNKNKVELKDIDVFGCCVGAGSFTGIRIGISTIKALAFANNKKVLGVTSFELVAYNKKVEKRLAVISAGHDNFYVAGYENLDLTLKPSFINKEELIALSSSYTLFSDKQIDGVETNVVKMATNIYEVVTKNLENATFDRETIVPLYVRKSQAEENLKC